MGGSSKPGGFVALDFETANGFPLSACALGLVAVEAGRVVAERHWLIRPPEAFRWFEPFNIGVHGIMPGDVAEAREFSAVWAEARGLVCGLPLVAHNGLFDFGLLELALAFFGLAPQENPRFCTMVLACSTSLAVASFEGAQTGLRSSWLFLSAS